MSQNILRKLLKGTATTAIIIVLSACTVGTEEEEVTFGGSFPTGGGTSFGDLFNGNGSDVFGGSSTFNPTSTLPTNESQVGDFLAPDFQSNTSVSQSTCSNGDLFNQGGLNFSIDQLSNQTNCVSSSATQTGIAGVTDPLQILMMQGLHSLGYMNTCFRQAVNMYSQMAASDPSRAHTLAKAGLYNCYVQIYKRIAASRAYVPHAQQNMKNYSGDWRLLLQGLLNQ